MNIRPYLSEDAPQVERCIRELQEFERALEPSRVEGTTEFARQALERMLHTCAEKEGHIFVAEVEETVVGFTCVWLLHGLSPITTISDAAYIAELVVLSDYRRQGIGRALLLADEAYARQRGMTTLRIEVLAANSVAHALYNDMDFRDFEISLTKELR